MRTTNTTTTDALGLIHTSSTNRENVWKRPSLLFKIMIARIFLQSIPLLKDTRLSCYSVTRLGNFWKIFVANFLTKLSQYSQIWNIFVLSKNCIGYWFLGYIFHISGYFLFQHLVSPPVNQSQSVSFKCRGRQQKQRIFWNSFRHEINQSYLDCG